MIYWKAEGIKEKRILFYDSIRDLDSKQYINYYLKYQLSPVIMGDKPSVTLTVKKEAEGKIKKEESLATIKELGLLYVVLRETPQAIILLVYRESLISGVLKNREVRNILQGLGYDLSSIRSTMACLVKRYTHCHCPDELGIFLGFALEDVKDYMEANIKQCLLCGYWKVYNDVGKAKETFAKYDQAKCTMLEQILGELSIKNQIA
jgi:hypothetical protein